VGNHFWALNPAFLTRAAPSRDHVDVSTGIPMVVALAVHTFREPPSSLLHRQIAEFPLHSHKVVVIAPGRRTCRFRWYLLSPVTGFHTLSIGKRIHADDTSDLHDLIDHILVVGPVESLQTASR